jgi:transcriptional regulator PpsR
MTPTNPTTDLAALSPHAPALADVVARIASDLALVIDAEGVVRSVSDGGAPLSPSMAAWVGRRWVDTASPDSQRKLQQLLDEAQQGGATRRREVNHPGPGGSDIAVAWSAIRLGDAGPVVAVGRDLRAVAAIQQRFLDAQQELERDHWRRREAENRYRQLFQVASDAVLVLDGATHHLLEHNGAAATMFPGLPSDSGPWLEGLPAMARAAVQELLLSAGMSGRAAEIRVRLRDDGSPCALSATPFRVGDKRQLLLRARQLDDGPATAAGLREQTRFVESTPDAVLVTDSAGRVQFANPAFVALVDHGDEAHLRGQPLADLVEDGEGRWRALIERARAQGLAQAEALVLRVGAATVALRASATLLTDGEQEAVGIVLHVLTPQGASQPSTASAWPELSQALARLGSAPVDALLAEVTLAAERHLLRSAWRASGGELRVWAQLLGLAESDLRTRLARLGLDERAEPVAGGAVSGPDGARPGGNGRH